MISELKMERSYLMHQEKFDGLLKSLSEFFKLLSHPIRIRIVGLLIQNEEMDVSSLQESIGTAQSSVSNHLKLLKLQGVLTEHREGTHIYYALKSQRIKAVVTNALALYALDMTTDKELVTLIQEMNTILEA